MPRPRALCFAWLLVMVAASLALGTRAAAAASAVQTLIHAEAVASGWNATAPPATGWMPVTLPDDWSHRWPHHDGVVWYRIHWRQTDASQPVGLLLNQVILADAVYVNGSLIHRDPHLVEPLSRSWIKPQYFVIDAPLLRAGTNTLLVRVSGLANYQPGLGYVELGDPQAVYAQYRGGWMVRYQWRLYNQAIYLAMGIVFLVLWLFRRSDTVYGWFALSTLFTAAWDWNNVAPGTWPFATTDQFQSWNMVFYLGAAVSMAVFLLRFCERRWRRSEAVLWLYLIATALVALVAPHVLGVYRFKLAVPAIGLWYVVPLVFIVFAVRHPRPGRIGLAVCLLIPLLVTVHDVLRFFEIIHDKEYVSTFTAPFTLIGMSIVLGWRYTVAMRRVEDFNYELRARVDDATTRLTATLGREHQLALANAQANSRLDLVRDLHDGFGGSLVSAIAALEHAPGAAATTSSVETLKALREDLRLVIETTTQDAADLRAPLESMLHRWTARLEAAGIQLDWSIENMEGVHLPPARSLDLLRLLQEALTNVLKHSQATHVQIDVRRHDDTLHLAMADDGCGFAVAQGVPVGGGGMGLANLRARAQRLGATLTIDSAIGRGTRLQLEVLVA